MIEKNNRAHHSLCAWKIALNIQNNFFQLFQKKKIETLPSIEFIHIIKICYLLYHLKENFILF